MTHAFVDTSVLLHAVGGKHPQREAARLLVRRVSDDLTIHVAAETIQEFVFHRMRMSSRQEAVDLSRWLLQFVVIHPFDAEVAERALEMIRTTAVGGRDAVLTATAIGAGFSTLVTHDHRFVSTPDLATVTAEEFLAAHPA